MNIGKTTWRWQWQKMVPLLPAILMVSCSPQAASQVQQVPTLQSGFEIPAAHYPQPLGTDLYVSPSPGAPWGDYAFDRTPGGGIPYMKPVQETTRYVGNGQFAPSVRYRSYIKTVAGEVHCNRVSVCKQDPKNPCQAAFSQCNLRLTNHINNIQFYLIKAGWAGPGPCGYCYQSVLVIDIAQDISSGIYETDILVFLDGKYLTTLPCIINVNP